LKREASVLSDRFLGLIQMSEFRQIF